MKEDWREISPTAMLNPGIPNASSGQVISQTISVVVEVNAANVYVWFASPTPRIQTKLELLVKPDPVRLKTMGNLTRMESGERLPRMMGIAHDPDTTHPKEVHEAVIEAVEVVKHVGTQE